MDRQVKTAPTASWLLMLTAGALALGLSGCGLFSKTPDLGGIGRAANPLNWFGSRSETEKGDDEAVEAGDEGNGNGEDPSAVPLPDSVTVGTVHMVDRRNDFLLIRATRSSTIDYGTEMIATGSNGRQTAELKLSPERKGAFLVADIIKGNPNVGDAVKLVGATDPLGDGGIVPANTGEVEVLE